MGDMYKRDGSFYALAFILASNSGTVMPAHFVTVDSAGSTVFNRLLQAAHHFKEVKSAPISDNKLHYFYRNNIDRREFLWYNMYCKNILD